MNSTHVKIEYDALVCMICAAAFIGYALGIQKVVNVIKPHHQYNKYSQTNLSELAELLTSNHLIVGDGGSGGQRLQKDLNDSNDSNDSNNSNATTHHVNREETKMNVVVESTRMVEEEDKGKCECESECQALKSNKDNENPNVNVSETIINNSGNVNNSEEEYEVVTGSIKKSYTKNKPRYYFSWFDSMF